MKRGNREDLTFGTNINLLTKQKCYAERVFLCLDQDKLKMYHKKNCHCYSVW